MYAISIYMCVQGNCPTQVYAIWRIVYFCCEYWQLLLISILPKGDLQVKLAQLATRPESRKAGLLAEGYLTSEATPLAKG